MSEVQPLEKPDGTPYSVAVLIPSITKADELAIVSQILFGADVVAMIIDSHPTFIFRR